jgi:hypothetical protein
VEPVEQSEETMLLSAELEKERRWRLVLGVDEEESRALSVRDQRLAAALNALYGSDQGRGKKQRGSLSRSAPKVSKWLGDIREFFPSAVVQVVQKDAFERLGLKEMLMEPEFLSALEADVHLVADLVSLRSVMPDKTIDTARQVIQKVVDELMERLERKTGEAIRPVQAYCSLCPFNCGNSLTILRSAQLR